MTTALEISVACVLTVVLLTIATVLAAFELGRLATRDDEQREILGVRARRIRP